MCKAPAMLSQGSGARGGDDADPSCRPPWCEDEAADWTALAAAKRPIAEGEEPTCDYDGELWFEPVACRLPLPSLGARPTFHRMAYPVSSCRPTSGRWRARG